MDIDFNNFIIHTKKGGGRTKYFKCSCSNCGKDRGYKAKSKVYKVCLDCKIKEIEYKEKHQKAIKEVRSTEESRQNTRNANDIRFKEIREEKQIEKEFKQTSPNWWRTGEWKDSISQSLIGNIPWNKGIPITEDQKIKQSCSLRGINIEDFNGFATDSIQNKLAHCLRSRLSLFLKKNKTDKAGSAVSDLGCTVEEFKIYIESKFDSWMNWDNYGRLNKEKSTWNIDHIIPLSSFNLENREEFLRACHYSNLQPMSAYENSVLKNDTTNYINNLNT